jgi:hypothetical protein
MKRILMITAAGGALTKPSDVDLGSPVWRR